MPDMDETGSAFLLGQISGQLRELIHSVNTVSAKQDALALRVAQLEAANSRREGATGVLAAVARSPAVAWLVSGVVTLWAILTGRIHL